MPPSRIVVLGCSGSGKSTLAAALAQRWGLPYVATDDIYWRPDWTPTPSSEVRAWIEAEAAKPAWVLDGNFDAQRDVLWGRAELAVWLDLPWATTVWRVAWRNLRWWAARTPVWGGLRMTWPKLVGGVRHAARGHAQKRATYPALLASFPALRVVRLRWPDEVRAWLAGPPEP
ncbi:MAG TPA: hypothetical protein VHW60_10090 [Caulobacteraceae bacterium]|nr:hypothetical protein [Caulobacteraceae bacterium]